MSRRRRRTRTVVSAGSTGAAPSAGGREPVLRFALFGVLGLLLLTPFVVTPGTVYPFVVGKALWSRSADCGGVRPVGAAGAAAPGLPAAALVAAGATGGRLWRHGALGGVRGAPRAQPVVGL